ncbi:hypothetical protein E2C01_006923 [Portunus trituberculatus]|uniref:Uncharacterized protein n=1 Tax=Portunus trituberculatus TaxID=210409 RepID=A0A5B7D104_PORTR|nr:hypothetical protein [Portunus trituberculatus]
MRPGNPVASASIIPPSTPSSSIIPKAAPTPGPSFPWVASSLQCEKTVRLHARKPWSGDYRTGQKAAAASS